MLPAIAPNDAYDRLQSLPFVDSASDGLMIHDLVQQAIATRLRSTDPERYHQYRRVAAVHQLQRFERGLERGHQGANIVGRKCSRLRFQERPNRHSATPNPARIA